MSLGQKKATPPPCFLKSHKKQFLSALVTLSTYHAVLSVKCVSAKLLWVNNFAPPPSWSRIYYTLYSLFLLIINNHWIEDRTALKGDI